MWIPIRTSIPNGCIAATISAAQSIAALGLLKTARNPSPTVLTSRPPKRSICWRMMLGCDSEFGK